jgi:hypothetical protein
MKADLSLLRETVEEQADDRGVWFVAETAAEGLLQHELRRLHTMIENATRWWTP